MVNYVQFIRSLPLNILFTQKYRAFYNPEDKTRADVIRAALSTPRL